MDPFSAAQLGLSVFSIVSGAGAESRANQAKKASNNIQIGHLQDTLGFTKDTAQAQKEMAEDEFEFSFEQAGIESGTAWDNIGRTMEKTLDTSKFVNVGAFGSEMDFIEGKINKQMKSRMDSFEKIRDRGYAAAEEYEISNVSQIENQIKLLKRENQELSKRDSLFGALLG